jgi:hypothetical protein
VPTFQLAPDLPCVSFDLEFTMYKLGYRYLNQELSVLLPLQIIMFVPCICQFTTEKRHSFIGLFIFVGADVDISNYIRRVANEHKVTRLPRRPARICLSADVSAQQT